MKYIHLSSVMTIEASSSNRKIYETSKWASTKQTLDRTLKGAEVESSIGRGPLQKMKGCMDMVHEGAWSHEERCRDAKPARSRSQSAAPTSSA